MHACNRFSSPSPSSQPAWNHNSLCDSCKRGLMFCCFFFFVLQCVSDLVVQWDGKTKMHVQVMDKDFIGSDGQLLPPMLTALSLSLSLSHTHTCTYSPLSLFLSQSNTCTQLSIIPINHSVFLTHALYRNPEQTRSETAMWTWWSWAPPAARASRWERASIEMVYFFIRQYDIRLTADATKVYIAQGIILRKCLFAFDLLMCEYTKSGPACTTIIIFVLYQPQVACSIRSLVSLSYHCDWLVVVLFFLKLVVLFVPASSSQLYCAILSLEPLL